jgi:hypothetical protein
MMSILGIQPDDDAGYEAALSRQLLNQEYGETIVYMLRAKMGPELAVHLSRREDGSFYAATKRLTKPLFATLDDYSVFRKTPTTSMLSIPSELAISIAQLWNAFLVRIRTPTRSDFLDKPDYFFRGLR